MKSVNSAGLLSDYLVNLAESFVKLFVLRIIQSPLNELSTTKSKLMANIKFGNPKGLSTHVTVKNDYPQMFDKIFDVLQFLRDSVIGAVDLQSQDWTPENELFVHVLFPMLFDTLSKACLAPSIPDNSEDMEKYGDFCDLIRKFDTRLKEARLSFPENENFEEFVKTGRLQYARRRKAHMLLHIREIIESEDQNTYEVEEATERGSLRSLYAARMGLIGGKLETSMPQGKAGMTEKHGLEADDVSFRLPKCHVSVQAQTLVEQAYQTLTEAVNMDSESASELYFCTRDMFDLFRSVAPILHADDLLNSPARAAIFFNDTLYISHHLLTLGYQFQKRLPEPVSKFATFLDMVPFFRALGERYFRAQLRKQRDIIKAFIADAGGFSQLTDDSRFETVERCAKQAITHLKGLSRVWKSILSVEMYLSSLGLLVDSFLDLVANETTCLGEVAKGEAHQLRYILGIICKVEEYFQTRVGKTAEKVAIRKYVSNWDNFLLLKDRFSSV
ncbi:Centromere/kinetochore Zw10-domain-containing protein [Chytriomyces sp. MP71]|nr:Centromere/kinetochore Zw10-domain-containing protein [Chytriomyces sp. MP71]